MQRAPRPGLGTRAASWVRHNIDGREGLVFGMTPQHYGLILAHTHHVALAKGSLHADVTAALTHNRPARLTRRGTGNVKFVVVTIAAESD